MTNKDPELDLLSTFDGFEFDTISNFEFNSIVDDVLQNDKNFQQIPLTSPDNFSKNLPTDNFKQKCNSQYSSSTSGNESLQVSPNMSPKYQNETFHKSNLKSKKISCHKTPKHYNHPPTYITNKIPKFNNQQNNSLESMQNYIVHIGNVPYKLIKTNGQNIPTEKQKFSSFNKIPDIYHTDAPKFNNRAIPTIKIKQTPIGPKARVYLSPDQAPIDAKPGQTIYFTNSGGQIQHLVVPGVDQIQKRSRNVDTVLDIGDGCRKKARYEIKDRVCLNMPESNEYDDLTINSEEEELINLLEKDPDIEKQISQFQKSPSPSPSPKTPSKLAYAKNQKISPEEIEILKQEGVNPDDYINKDVLNSIQVQMLKKVRRKIRNKKSAQISRRKKKKEFECLQGKYKMVADENSKLKTKIKILQTENSELQKQLNNLKNFISAASQRTAQATTCVMLLVISLAFFFAPKSGPLSMLSPFKNGKPSIWQANKVTEHDNMFMTRRILQIEDGDGNLLEDAIINEPSFDSEGIEKKIKNVESDKIEKQVKVEKILKNENIDDDGNYEKFLSNNAFTTQISKQSANYLNANLITYPSIISQNLSMSLSHEARKFSSFGAKLLKQIASFGNLHNNKIIQTNANFYKYNKRLML